TGAVRSEARAALEQIAKRMLDGESPDQQSSDSIRNPQSAIRNDTTVAVGARVMVGGLGLEATVTAVHDGTADLDVRGKRMRASVRDLRIIGGQPAAAKVSVNVELQPREGATADLNVIGCTVDEAITRAERFLDESLLTDQ